MKAGLGFLILLLFQLIGLFFERVLHIPLPGNVIGLVLCLLALSFKWIRLEWIEQPSSWLLKHMMLFFAPIIVGTMLYFSVLQAQWPAVTATLVVSTLVVMGITAWTAKKWTRSHHEEGPT